MEKIKLGIVGMGRMGITHFSIVNSCADVDIVAVADTSNLTLTLLERYLPTLKVYSDYQKLIDESKPDALIVCTPPNLHYSICKYSCDNGIHAFCEKPFTTDPDEAEALYRMFRDRHLINQVGYVNRFNDAFVMVKRMLNTGLIGNVIRFKSEMFSCTILHKEKEESWRSKRENGGGAVYEMASHAIDLVNFLIGVPNNVVGTSMNQIYSKNVEDIVSSTFLYDNGISGTLYVNWSDTSYRKPSNKFEVFGTKGKILADQHGIRLFMNEADVKSCYRKGWNTIYITDIFTPVPFYVRGYEFTRQLYYFIDSIKERQDGKICTFEDGFNAQCIIHRMFNDCQL